MAITIRVLYCFPSQCVILSFNINFHAGLGPRTVNYWYFSTQIKNLHPVFLQFGLCRHVALDVQG